MSEKSTPLNARQLRFCAEYNIDLNATQAAIRAGYSAKTATVQGPRLLFNERILKRIEELQDLIAVRNEIDTDRVISMLQDTYHAAMAAKQFGPAVRAAELLGKHLSMFVDRLQIEPAAALTDEELATGMARKDDGTLDQVIYQHALKLLKGPTCGEA